MFCVGLIGEKQISAFSICFQVEGFAWMVISIVICVILFDYVLFAHLLYVKCPISSFFEQFCA